MILKTFCSFTAHIFFYWCTSIPHVRCFFPLRYFIALKKFQRPINTITANCSFIIFIYLFIAVVNYYELLKFLRATTEPEYILDIINVRV